MRLRTARATQPAAAERMRSIITVAHSMTVVADGHRHEVHSLDGAGPMGRIHLHELTDDFGSGDGTPRIPIRVELTDIAPTPVRDRLRARVTLTGLVAAPYSAETTESTCMHLGQAVIEDAEGRTYVPLAHLEAAETDPLAGCEAAMLHHLVADHPDLVTLLLRLADPAAKRDLVRALPSRSTGTASPCASNTPAPSRTYGCRSPPRDGCRPRRPPHPRPPDRGTPGLPLPPGLLTTPQGRPTARPADPTTPGRQGSPVSHPRPPPSLRADGTAGPRHPSRDGRGARPAGRRSRTPPRGVALPGSDRPSSAARHRRHRCRRTPAARRRWRPAPAPCATPRAPPDAHAATAGRRPGRSAPRARTTTATCAAARSGPGHVRQDGRPPDM